MDKTRLMNHLVSELNHASKLYYSGKDSDMSNKEWDKKFDELVILEKELGTQLFNSPTRNVGFIEVDELEKVKHPKKMLSLDKTKGVNELITFIGNRHGALGWKLDGLTIVLTYDENGVLVDAVTRGDGTTGSRIIHNAKVFKNIPHEIPYKGGLVIRGEALISKDDFKKINANGEYANERNLASGSVMQLNSKKAKERCLQFIAFSVAECGIEFDDFLNQMEWIESLGFDIVPLMPVDKTNMAKAVEIFKNKIQDYMFATDGLVLIHNDIKYGKSLGATAHHENNAMALKWQDETKETTLRDIKFQVGRTGILSPVAMFDTISIEGSNVSKAYIHNIGILKSLELGIGDTITVYKANMIIPQIDDNLTRSNTFKIPTVCPVCGGELKIDKTTDGEFLKHVDENGCSGQIIRSIAHYCSRDALNIDGLSEKTVETLYSQNIIKSINDLYSLEEHKSEILKLPKFGIKKYNNLVESINNSKNCKLENFIFGLGIKGVGKSTARDLVAFCKTEYSLKSSKDILDFIMKMGIKDLLKVKDLGDVTANNLVEHFTVEENHILIVQLVAKLNFIDEEMKPISTNGAFSGKTIYCTGTFARAKKNELKTLVETNGGVFANGYTKSLSYLVVGSLKGSSKSEKAIKDGVAVLTEDEFFNMIENK